MQSKETLQDKSNARQKTERTVVKLSASTSVRRRRNCKARAAKQRVVTEIEVSAKARTIIIARNPKKGVDNYQVSSMREVENQDLKNQVIRI